MSDYYTQTYPKPSIEPPQYSESDDRAFDPVTKRTLGTLTRMAKMKGYPPPKAGLLEHEARSAISWLARLQPGEDGKAKRLPAALEHETPHFTLRGWRTRRP